MKSVINWIVNFAKNNVIVTIIIVAIIAYILYVAISNYIQKRRARDNYKAAVDQAQDALNQLADQGVTPSYAQAQYTTWGNALEKAFSGCGAGWGDIVKPTLEQIKNDADVFALIQAYGVREIDECGWGTFEGDLGATIGYKFSGFRFCDCIPLPVVGTCTCDKCGCLESINDILKSKNVQFKF